MVRLLRLRLSVLLLQPRRRRGLEGRLRGFLLRLRARRFRLLRLLPLRRLRLLLVQLTPIPGLRVLESWI